jgi:hypothetical protein
MRREGILPIYGCVLFNFIAVIVFTIAVGNSSKGSFSQLKSFNTAWSKKIGVEYSKKPFVNLKVNNGACDSGWEPLFAAEW